MFIGLSSEQVAFVFGMIRDLYGDYQQHKNAELAQLEGKLSIMGEAAHGLGNRTKPIENVKRKDDGNARQRPKLRDAASRKSTKAPAVQKRKG
jgi:hypothetical protein